MTVVATPGSWPIVFYDPLPIVRRELVRFQGLNQGYACHPARRHYAAAPFDDVDIPLDSPKRIWMPGDVGIAADDPRWPARCAGPACPHEGGYLFQADDFRQVMGGRLMAPVTYRDGGVRPERLDRMPVGAVYRANISGMPLRWNRGMRDSVQPHEFLGGEFVAVTPDGLWWITQEGRAGEKFIVESSIGSDAVTVIQTAGPPSRWTIIDGVLAARAPAPEAS